MLLIAATFAIPGTFKELANFCQFNNALHPLPSHFASYEWGTLPRNRYCPMSELEKLAEQMRSDWDRRIAHDYRFWMSDGHADDRTMWESGARDFAILTKNLSPLKSETFLELGCGVGRILRAALNSYGKVIGVDVSAEAVARARTLLGEQPGLSLFCGNGLDISMVADASVNVLASFAAISSIPTDIVANYLREMHRVLAPDGIARVQLYIGTEQTVQREDTLHLRCYRRENLEEALRRAGLRLEAVEELVLPIQVSFKEIGIEAVVATFRRTDSIPADAESIARALLPGGESANVEGTLGNDLEYWMTVNYARELAERGDLDKARETLEFAERVSHTTAVDVGDMLQRIVSTIEKSAGSSSSVASKSKQEPVTSTLSLSQRFPETARILETLPAGQAEVRESAEGPVTFLDGQCLDHPTKPVASAVQWARRLLEESKYQGCEEVVVVGLGAGYHLEALFAAGCTKPVHVIEPDPRVLRAAIGCRNPGAWLEKIASLHVGPSAQLPEGHKQFELFIRPQTQAVANEACTRVKADFYGKRGLALLKPNIGVLGPLSGGTLPMVAYVCRALFGLEQRFREYDVSGFAGGYDNLERFVHEKPRRSGVENTYCEMVSQVLLESINEKPVDILICMALAPITPRVLTELRKRGIITVLWFVEDYTRFTYWKEMAKFYDFVFTIQKGRCLESIRNAGAGEVHYLPVGCDPGIHAPMQLSEEERQRWGSPISFMGAGYHNRQQLFASLADHPLKIWGTEWPTCRPFDRLVQEGGRRLTPMEYVKVFNASDININLHSSHERDGVDPFGDFLNPRTFELAASGVFQLVDERSLLAEAFEVGKEMVTFTGVGDLKQKIGHYLAHPEERAAVVAASRARVLREHTYGARIKQMLSIIYSSRYEQIKNRMDASPWKRMLARAKPHPELYNRCEKSFQRGEEPILDGLVSDVVTGQGKLSETEQKLMFLFHVRKQIIRMKEEERGGKR